MVAPTVSTQRGHAHLWHLKCVARETDRLFTEYAFDRLVLAGPAEATAELRRLLPKRLRTQAVVELLLPIDAGPSNVLNALLPVIQHVERTSTSWSNR